MRNMIFKSISNVISNVPSNPATHAHIVRTVALIARKTALKQLDNEAFVAREELVPSYSLFQAVGTVTND